MTTTINSIKDTLAELIGEDIVITIEAGRRKTTIHHGELADTYPAIFTVELDNDDNGEESYERVSFSYADILTETIEVEFPSKPEISFVLEEEDKK